MIFILVTVLIIISILMLFASPKLSPVPYYPSNKKDLPLIIKALDLKNNQVVFDLGAGDGIVIFRAAKWAYEQKLNTQFVAVEINPVLILILYLQKLFHPNIKNIKVVWGDFFKLNFKRLTFNLPRRQAGVQRSTFYLYISPWLLDKTVSVIKKQLRDFSVISYFYPIPTLKKKEKIIKGVKNIYIYLYKALSYTP